MSAKLVRIEIDGKQIECAGGTSVLQAALDNGIYIPNLCWIRETRPQASCRLCWVEIVGYPRPITACTETVKPGMVINTRGENALRLTRRGFELLMSAHPTDCALCPVNRKCELQKIAAHLRVKLKTDKLRQLDRGMAVDTTSPLFVYTPNKCVLCGRCIWACRKKYGNGAGAIGFVRRGFLRRVSTFAEEPVGTSACRDCKDCISVCPAGALTFKTCSQAQANSKLKT